MPALTAVLRVASGVLLFVSVIAAVVYLVSGLVGAAVVAAVLAAVNGWVFVNSSRRARGGAGTKELQEERCQGCGGPLSEGGHGMSEYGGCV